MPESIEDAHIYCIFCKTGLEGQIREEIERRVEGVRVLSAMQEKHRKIEGLRKVERRAFLPGYLFLFGKKYIDFHEIARIEGVYYALENMDHERELRGSDRAFAEWLWMNDGVIGLSKLRFLNGQMEVLAGPMQHFTEEIVRVDKHSRNALVRKNFLGRIRDIWLAFEFEDEASLSPNRVEESD